MPASLLYPAAGAAFAIAFSGLLIGCGETADRALVVAAGLVVAVLVGRAIGRRQEALMSLGTIDPLTRLPNRRYFEQTLERELIAARRSGEPLALLVVDVDALKRINDQLGHHAGDAAIRVVADALRGTCRGSDLAARWGGDEFVVLAPNTNAEQAQQLVQRIAAGVPLQSALSNATARMNSQPRVPGVSATIGFAIASSAQPATLGPAGLFAAADLAMYRKKGIRRISGPLTTLAHSPKALTSRLERFAASRR